MSSFLLIMIIWVATQPKGDQIYNGAVDNCSASACLLALAGYYTQFKGRLPVNLILPE